MPIDYSKYPDNWTKEIVPRILDRAGNCCEICGLENGQTVYSVKVFARRYKIINGVNIEPWGHKQIWFRDKRDTIGIEVITKEIKPVKVVLTIAHLDHDAENKEIKDTRLKAMCQKCHLAYDEEEKYNKRNNKNQLAMKI